MWMPTHVQVTVQKAVGLLTKGKHNTNDCFVTIALGKTKYQTSIKDKAGPNVEWHEECELPIPDQGNTAEIILNVLHHNTLGIDEFLGRISIPLNTLDVYERPKNKWYTLSAKPGKSHKTKERGQLEVKIGFTVKSGSLTDLSKKDKHKTSIGQLSHAAQSIGGSLLSLGSAENRKGLKKIARSIGSKMHLKSRKKDDCDDNSSIGSISSLRQRNIHARMESRQTRTDADPGVVSEDEFTFDDLSHKSSETSLNQMPPESYVNDDKPQESKSDEWKSKLCGGSNNALKINSEILKRRSLDISKLSPQIKEESIESFSDSKISPISPKKDDILFNKYKQRKDIDTKRERIIIGGENEPLNSGVNNRLSNDLLQKFDGKTREDLILIVSDLQNDLEKHKRKLKDLEDYLDDLLLRVMETTPRILQNPYVTWKPKKM